jgi:hypothetical protein
MLMAKAGYDPRTALTVWTKVCIKQRHLLNRSLLTYRLLTQMAELEETTNSDAERVAQVAKEKAEANAEEMNQSVVETTIEQRNGAYEDLNISVKDFVERLLSSWFGSTHPPSTERVEYMQEHLPLAIEIYEKSLAINGKPVGFEIPQEQTEQQEDHSFASTYFDNSFFRWIAHLFGSTGDSGQTVDI